jgi:hypothetical protein
MALRRVSAPGAGALWLSLISAGRPRADVQDVVGLFMNHVPLRVPLGDAGAFDPAFAAARGGVLDALRNEVPLVSLLDDAPEVRAECSAVTGGVAVQLAPAPPSLRRFDVVAGRESREPVLAAALEFHVRPMPQGPVLEVLFDPARCPARLAESLADDFARALVDDVP